MGQVYNHESREVLLARFTDSQMMADNVGKATSHVEDYWRSKTYVKPIEMLGGEDYPVFPQPYSWAAANFGGSWNDYNQPMVIQVGLCNLDCWYCFVDKNLRSGNAVTTDGVEVGAWFTAKEVMEMFKSSGKKLLRISGGEPTLAPEFILDMYDLMGEIDHPLWVDTNMSTGDRFFELAEEAADAATFSGSQLLNDRDLGNLIGMCGCFKGFTDEQVSSQTGHTPGLLDKQFKFAGKMADCQLLDSFWYVPDVHFGSVTRKVIVDFFYRMQDEVHYLAPLRTYILHVKNYTPNADTPLWGNAMHVTADTRERPIDVWRNLCRGTYPPQLLWIPNDQLSFEVGRTYIN